MAITHTNTNHRSVLSALSFAQLKKPLGLLAGLFTLCTLGACTVATGSSDEGAGVASRADDLVAIDEPQEFKYLSDSSIPVLTGSTGDPAMCTPSNGSHSKLIFSRDTTGYVNGEADVIGISGPWGKYGGSGSLRKFGTHAACAFLDSGSTSHFIIVARGTLNPSGQTDNHLFWSRGEWDVTGSAPAPTALTQWTQIDTNTYSTNGSPAMAAFNGQTVLTYLNDSGQIFAHYWNTTTSSFSARIQGPTMPTGWTAIGSPTIAFTESWAQKFLIVVRAKNASNQYRLYFTFFAGTTFVGAPGGPASYEQLALPSGAPIVQSDPAVEWDGNLGTSTLYYRNSTTIYQTSGLVDDFGSSKIKAISLLAGTPSISVNSNPVVIGGVPYEAGRHWVLARGTDNNIYFGESFNDEHLSPN